MDCTSTVKVVDKILGAENWTQVCRCPDVLYIILQNHQAQPEKYNLLLS